MSAKSGEKAREAGDFLCEKCRQVVRVNKGAKIPRCPNCGNPTFDAQGPRDTSAAVALSPPGVTF